MTIEGVTIPDIRAAAHRRSCPFFESELCREDELGKQRCISMGGFPRITPSLVHFVTIQGQALRIPVKPSIRVDGVGSRGVNRRRSTTTAFNHVQFWDGRARSLEEQAIGPIHNPVEMAET